MHRLNALRDESGMVLPLAMIILVTVILLAAVVVDSSVSTSRNASQQQVRRVALEVADAGLQAAVYRLSSQPNQPTGNTQPLNPSLCFTATSPGTALNADNTCPGRTDSYGSIGSYTYYVTPALGTLSGGLFPLSACSGYPLNPPADGTEITQRCVTSVGTVNGVVARVQERVAALSFTFPVAGILSMSTMLFDTNNTTCYRGYTGPLTSNTTPKCPPVQVNGYLEANGAITFSGSASYDIVNGTIQYGPSGSVQLQSPAICASPNCTSTPTGTAFQRPQGADITAYKNSAVTNDDTGLGSFYTASTRTLSVPSGTTLTFPTGNHVYNFCSVSVNSGNVIIPANSSVTIYVDNSLTGDGCKTGGTDGQLFENNDEFLNNNPDPGTLQIRVWGDPGVTPAKANIGLVTLNDDNNPLTQQGMTYGDVYAPDSWITTNGKGLRWTGGIVAGAWESNDNDYIGAAPGFTNNPTQNFYPTAWDQCPPDWSGTDATAGCH
jgi:hypothetical protein